MAHDHDAAYIGAFENGDGAWLTTADRRRHLYVIGRSGAGKSTLLKNLMLDDLANNRPFALIDPHGDLAIQIASAVPPERTNDVIFIDMSDKEHHVGLNPLHNVPPTERPRVAANMLATFIHAWQLNLEVNARLLNVLNAGLRLILDAPEGGTLLGVPRLLRDTRYRAHLVSHCTDPVVRQFWNEEVERYSERYEVEAFAPLQSRLNLLLTDPAIRHVVSQKKSTIDVGRVMQEGKTLLLRLPRGKLGEVPCYLLGALFATAFAQAAEARADQPEEERHDFALILDEFQYASTTSIADVLSGSRKYRLHLVLAHQFLGQISELLRKAIPANAGSLVCFEVSPEDAEVLAAEFNHDDTIFDQSTLRDIDMGKFNPARLSNMQPHTAWVRLMQDGQRSERQLLFPPYLDTQSRRRFIAVRNNSIAGIGALRASNRSKEYFMDLIYSPFACSLAAHIVCREAGLSVSLRRVDLESKELENGGSLFDLSPKGKVPTLVRSDGSILTEVPSVLLYLASLAPNSGLGPRIGDDETFRMLEWLNFVATEIHKRILFTTFDPTSDDAARSRARTMVDKTLDHVGRALAGRTFLVGDRFTAADAYLVWSLIVLASDRIGIALPLPFKAFLARCMERPAVREAVSYERRMLT